MPNSALPSITGALCGCVQYFDVIWSLLAALDGFLFFFFPAIYPNALFGAHYLAHFVFSIYGVAGSWTTTCLHFFVDHLINIYFY
jgi:hypothetical protein